MAFNLFGTIAIGIGAAGTILILFRLLGRRAPRWLIPAAAGLAMFTYQIWEGYTWHQRTADALPDEFRVVKTYQQSSAFSPWTYLIPQVNRFIAVDGSKLRRNDKLPGYVLAELIFVERLSPTVVTQQLFDCPNARRTDVLPSGGFDEDGLPQDANWVPVGEDSLLFDDICAPEPADKAGS